MKSKMAEKFGKAKKFVTDAVESHQSNSIIQMSTVECGSCRVAMNAFDNIFMANSTMTFIEDKAYDICMKYLSYGSTICTEMIDRMAPIIMQSMVGSFLSADYMCAEILKICDKPVYVKESGQQAATQILSDKPAFLKDNNYINNLYSKIKADKSPRKSYKAVQLSDIHMDYSYTPTADQPYGQLGWETPYSVLQAALDYIKTEIKPDLAFWTGDNSKSDTWGNTQDQVIDYVINSTNAMVNSWADTNITIMPIQGNHDTWPVNVEDFSSPGINGAINGFKQVWQQFLDPDQYTLFGEWGYFAQSLKLKNGSELPNTKVIGLNTQACSYWNWYLMEARYDPAGMIEFLETELAALEAVNGSAIIIAHMPPGSCLHPYGIRMQAIQERYQHIIKFALYGHTHKNDFIVAKAINESTQNVGLNIVTGSLTMQPNNPCFAVINIDAEYMLPTNVEVFMMDLDASNTKKSPVWISMFDYISTYQLPDLSPNSLQILADQILNNETFAIEYDWNRQKRGSKMTSCDDQCRRDLYCSVTTLDEFQRKTCRNATVNIVDQFLDIMMNIFTDPWIKKTT